MTYIVLGCIVYGSLSGTLPQRSETVEMLASAPLIVLVCFLLSYLKGLNLLLLICAATLLYCVRRHTFKPAVKSGPTFKANKKAPPLVVESASLPDTTAEESAKLEEEAAKKVFWQSSPDKQSNVYSFPKTSTRQAAK
jgi:hypothetical protein